MTSPLTKQLELDGIALLPDLLSNDQLESMQRSFAGRLRRLRWNDVDGYEKTEPHRHMVQDILTLDQGFVDAALHPRVKEALSEYLGSTYELVEAKGWKSLPTKRDFHGWHGDAWYDQTQVEGIPREVKLGLYLTDVKTGAFQYLKGSHRQQAPRTVANGELGDVAAEKIVEVTGPAGMAFLFDTSGIHRQSVPILEPRQAVFYNYHDPRIPLQKEDVEYYRYHPLILNAAFLGNLSEQDRCILGFGNKTHYQPAFERGTDHEGYLRMLQLGYTVKLRARDLRSRVVGRLKRLLRLGRS
jgi:hypothetical protein